jgi:hypothetical protein
MVGSFDQTKFIAGLVGASDFYTTWTRHEESVALICWCSPCWWLMGLCHRVDQSKHVGGPLSFGGLALGVILLATMALLARVERNRFPAKPLALISTLLVGSVFLSLGIVGVVGEEIEQVETTIGLAILSVLGMPVVFVVASLGWLLFRPRHESTETGTQEQSAGDHFRTRSHVRTFVSSAGVFIEVEAGAEALGSGTDAERSSGGPVVSRPGRLNACDPRRCGADRRVPPWVTGHGRVRPRTERHRHPRCVLRAASP